MRVKTGRERASTHGHGELTDSQIAIILVERHEVHGHLVPRSSKPEETRVSGGGLDSKFRSFRSFRSDQINQSIIPRLTRPNNGTREIRGHRRGSVRHRGCSTGTLEIPRMRRETDDRQAAGNWRLAVAKGRESEGAECTGRAGRTGARATP